MTKQNMLAIKDLGSVYTFSGTRDNSQYSGRYFRFLKKKNREYHKMKTASTWKVVCVLMNPGINLSKDCSLLSLRTILHAQNYVQIH